MKIGVMLRHLDQHVGGVKVYTKNLLPALFSAGPTHEFVLLYKNSAHLGKYADFSNVREVALPMPTVLLWDQLAVRMAEKKEQFDIIFNLKYSVPLKTNCPTVFVCHGLDWYVMPWGSRWIDRLSHRHLIPRYAKKADGIICVSDTTREHVLQYLGVPNEQLCTVYHGIDEVFRVPIPREKLEDTRRSYNLPDRFFLYCGQIYPPKNFGRLVSAYALVGPNLGIPLVVAGQRAALGGSDLALIEKLGISSWVKRVGWINNSQLPSFYALAEALLLPSLYESFGMPLLEAMACGCPVLTANRYATKEIVKDAGILVNPENVQDIAEGMRQILSDENLRSRLIKAGRNRSKDFGWEKCARQTMDFLERTHSVATTRRN